MEADAGDAKEAIQQQEQQLVQLILKNPAHHSADVTLRCDPDATTVAALKQRLRNEYPGRPEPAAQTVSIKRGGERGGSQHVCVCVCM